MHLHSLQLLNNNIQRVVDIPPINFGFEDKSLEEYLGFILVKHMA